MKYSRYIWLSMDYGSAILTMWINGGYFERR